MAILKWIFGCSAGVLALAMSGLQPSAPRTKARTKGSSVNQAKTRQGRGRTPTSSLLPVSEEPSVQKKAGYKTKSAAITQLRWELGKQPENSSAWLQIKLEIAHVELGELIIKKAALSRGTVAFGSGDYRAAIKANAAERTKLTEATRAKQKEVESLSKRLLSTEQQKSARLTEEQRALKQLEEQHKKTIDKLATERESLQTEIAKTKQELSAQRSKISGLEQSSHASQTELQSARQSLAGLQAQMKETEQQSQTLSSQLDAARQQANDTTARLKTLGTELEESRNKRKELEEYNKRLTESHTAALKKAQEDAKTTQEQLKAKHQQELEDWAKQREEALKAAKDQQL